MIACCTWGRFHDALTARMDEAEQQRQRLVSDCAAQMKQTRQALLASLEQLLFDRESFWFARMTMFR